MTNLRTILTLALPLLSLACTPSDSTAPDVAAKDDIRTEEVTYNADGTSLRGYLAMPASTDGDVPGVIVAHEWWGHNDYVRGRADQLARMGYAAFALDMYGDGKQAEHPGDAQAFMQEAMSNADVTAARFRAALAILNGRDGVDTARTAAIGYCMGGAVVLGMARAGEDLAAVVSFHGSLGTESPATVGGVKARVLVCTGAADPFVPAEAVTSFRSEMDVAGAHYQVVEYAGAQHAFTNPGATAKGEEFDLPLCYDADADRDSWARMTALFDELF